MSKPPKHPKCYDANLANMKLLISDKEFQNIVAEVRKTLGIPVGGIKTDDDLKRWSDSWIAASDAVLEKPDYYARGRAITDEWKAKKIDSDEYYRRINLYREEVPINYRWGRARFIVEKFNLPENYLNHVDTYIVQGRITAPYHNFVIGPWTELRSNEKLSTVRHIPVTFYTIPTQEDIRLAMQQVQWFAKYRGMPRYKPMKHIDRDLSIEEWYRRGEQFDPVEQKPYKTTTSEIASELLGTGKKSDAVRYIVKDLEKTRKKRFRKRGKS